RVLTSTPASDPACTTHICTLSLHDALPISAHALPFHGVRDRRCRAPSAHLASVHQTRRARPRRRGAVAATGHSGHRARRPVRCGDRKSTRLNSSHVKISYAVFCLKKKKKEP